MPAFRPLVCELTHNRVASLSCMPAQDYTGSNVNAESFLAVLSGNEVATLLLDGVFCSLPAGWLQPAVDLGLPIKDVDGLSHALHLARAVRGSACFVHVPTPGAIHQLRPDLLVMCN